MDHIEKETNDLQAKHEFFTKEFNDIQSLQREDREQSVEDRRFATIAGAQWEGALGEQFKNKPKYTLNKVGIALKRIDSNYRNNKISVKFLSKGGNDKLATTCQSLLRADEYDSNAEEAYDNAFTEAMQGGIGAWRLTPQYENDEDAEEDEQRIQIEPIFDADSSVYFDLNTKRQDKSDASRCYVLTAMTPDAYRDEWGDKISSVTKQAGRTEFDWYANDVVYVAEVYQREKYTKKVNIYKLHGTKKEEKLFQEDIEDNPVLEVDLTAKGWKLDRTRKLKTYRVRKYFISGNEILEDCGYIAGKYIPIVPMYGERWFIDNRERFKGHVRDSKDAQRLTNLQVSKLAEISSVSSAEKPIMPAEMVQGWESYWEEDNVKSYPYLPINPMTDANGTPIQTTPVAYTRSPNVPPALVGLYQTTQAEMNEILGGNQNQDQIVSNISDDAVLNMHDRSDMQSYIYTSNMAKAMKWSGRVWLSMARELYIEDNRKMKALEEDNTVKMIELNQPVQKEDGGMEYLNNMADANFDIISDVGASSTTKRKATVKTLQNALLGETDPENKTVLSSLIMLNMEGEGLSDVRPYYRRKLINIGALTPTDSEKEELLSEAQNRQPTAQDEYLQKEAQKSEALAQKAQADTALSMAKKDETVAKTLETFANIEQKDREQILSLWQNMQTNQGQL